MKNALYLLIVVAAIVGCDDDDSKSSQNEKVANLKNIASSGSWRVTHFVDSDEDETDNFDGYVFQFTLSGVLTATNGSTVRTGAWSITDDGSNDDSNDYDDIDFNISFTSPSDFEELSEDWEIVSIDNSEIQLVHVSGGNGGTDLLTFEKL